MYTDFDNDSKNVRFLDEEHTQKSERYEYAKFYTDNDIRTISKKQGLKEIVSGKIPWTPNGPHDCAVVTGDYSGGLFIVDVDVKNGKNGFDFLTLNSIKLPKTYTVRTPSGGAHYYYGVLEEAAKAILRRITDVAFFSFENDIGSNGIDLLYGAGSSEITKFCFAPPSKDYYSDTHIPIAILSYDILIEFLSHTRNPKSKKILSGESVSPFRSPQWVAPYQKTHAGHADPDQIRSNAERYLRSSLPAIQGQQGDARLFKTVLGLLGKYPLSQEEAIDLLTECYNPICEPPWKKNEWEKTIRHKIKCAQGYLGMPASDFGEKHRSESPQKNNTTDTDMVVLPNNTDTAISEYYVKTFISDGVVISTGSSLYAYNEETGIYNEIQDIKLQSGIRCMECTLYAKNEQGNTSVIKINKNRSSSIAHRILVDKHILNTNFLCKEKNTEETYTAFKNKTVVCGLKSKSISYVEHSPTHNLIHAYDYDIDAEQDDCPLFKKFLFEVFENDAQANSKIMVLQEFFGACLLNIATHFQKMLGLVGSGGNGKSVLLKTIREGIFSGGGVSAVPLQKFSNPRSLHGLVGARVNIVTELPSMELSESSVIKSVIDGDIATAEQKYVNEFLFTPTCGHVFAVNNLPTTQDNSHGFWRRMMVIDFPNIFTGERVIRGLELDLIKERSGIAAWSLVGAQRLIKEGSYTHLEISGAEEQCKIESDSVYAFFNECLILDESCENTVSKIYSVYESYCAGTGRKPTSAPRMSRRLQELGVKSKRTKAARFLCCAFL